MGALMRATRDEVEELFAGEPEWWPGLLGAVATDGYAAMLEERERRCWSERALMGWVFKSPERLEEYQAAQRIFVGARAHRTSAVVDAGPANGEDVKRDALRVAQAFRLAEKVDPENWGKRIQHEHSAVGDLGDRLRRARGRVVDVTPEVVPVAQTATCSLPSVVEVVSEGEI